jgi:hypothetical protein
VSEEAKHTELEAHRLFAGKLNGEVWDLLGKPDRSAAETERMIHAAHASCYHWLQVGTGLHHQRAEWLLSHVYAEVGYAEPALRHARRCQALTDEHADLMQDFDRAYAYECIGRANAVAGNRKEALEYLALAQEAGKAIADQESRQIFVGDLDGGNWAGLRSVD